MLAPTNKCTAIIHVASEAIKLFDSLWWIRCYLLLSSLSKPELILMNKPLVNESSKKTLGLEMMSVFNEKRNEWKKQQKKKRKKEKLDDNRRSRFSDLMMARSDCRIWTTNLDFDAKIQIESFKQWLCSANYPVASQLNHHSNRKTWFQTNTFCCKCEHWTWYFCTGYLETELILN